MDHLNNYDFEIIYKPGKLNVVADALSRQQQEEQHLNAIIEITDDWIQKIQEEVQTDQEAQKIIDKINEEPGTANKWKIRNNKLYYEDRLFIPKNLRVKILQEHHDIPLAGHFGFDKTYEALNRNFYWPKMYTSTKSFIASCDICQRNKTPRQAPAGLLQPLPIPNGNWEQISMDFIVQLPKTNSGKDAITVFVDRLSKQTHFVASRTTDTAPDVAKIFFDNIFRLHGLPRVIICDRDPKFTSNFWQSLFKTLGTKIALSTAFHPQTDGQTERMNQTLEQMLRTYVNYRQNDWDEHLTAAEFACNNAQQKSTKMTPFFLNYGHHPLTPATLALEKIESTVQAADDFVKTMTILQNKAQDAIREAQLQQAKYADEKRREESFEINDMVLLSSRHITLRVLANQPSKKLQNKFLGPYKIIAKISAVAYKLDLPPNMRIHPVFHVSLLKRYTPNDDEKFPDREVIPPEPILVNDEMEYEVEEILDQRITKKGNKSVPQYLIKWKGYPLHDATWEPLSNLNNAEDALQRYHNSI